MNANDRFFLAGIEAARAAFNELYRSGDWEGQVSMGFAATFDQYLDEELFQRGIPLDES